MRNADDISNKQFYEGRIKNAVFVYEKYGDIPRAQLNLLASIAHSLASIADSLEEADE